MLLVTNPRLGSDYRTVRDRNLRYLQEKGRRLVQTLEQENYKANVENPVQTKYPEEHPEVRTGFFEELLLTQRRYWAGRYVQYLILEISFESKTILKFHNKLDKININK